MADLNFCISSNIILGSYSTANIAQNIAKYGKRFMVVMDPMLKDTGSDKKITTPLQGGSIQFFVYDNISDAATTENLDTALELARKGRVEGIIGAGGGKAIHAAMAISALFNEKKDIYRVIDDGTVCNNPIPLICIPTTGRDTFMFSNMIPLVDSRNSQVKLIRTRDPACRSAFFDPTLTMALSEKQKTSMVIECLGMAIESYISQKASFFSDMIVEKTVGILSHILNPQDKQNETTSTEELLCRGGSLASIACAMTGPGAATLIAYCFSTAQKLNRSITTTILLPHILEDAGTYRQDKLEKIQELMQIPSANDEAGQPLDAARILQDHIRNHIAKSNLPGRLKDLSLSIDDLAKCASNAGGMELGSGMGRSMSGNDLFELVKKAY